MQLPKRRDTSTALFGPLQLLGLPRESLEIIDHGGNQLLSTRVLCVKGSGKKIEKIARLLGSFMPIRSRRCKQVSFQLILPKAQGLRVGFDVCQQAPQIGGLLSGHAAPRTVP